MKLTFKDGLEIAKDNSEYINNTFDMLLTDEVKRQKLVTLARTILVQMINDDIKEVLHLELKDWLK